MKFISRYTRLRVGLMPTTKQIVHGGSGSQQLLVYKGITVEFENAVFDTKNWRKYSRPENPDQYNPVKSEEDLILMLKGSEFFGIDFFEHQNKTSEERKLQLQKELAEIEAKEAAENPEQAPETPGRPDPKDSTLLVGNSAENAGKAGKSAKATKKGKASPAKSPKSSKSSKLEL